MQITLLTIRKTSDPHLAALINDYRHRLEHYVPFELVVLDDIKNAKNLSQEQVKQAESDAIMRYLTPSMDVILLDEHGKQYRSIEFAQWMQKKMSSGRDLTLVIGGPYGFSSALYARANGKLSFGPMTFSHQMIRLMAIEQIYRAMTILRGEPYHHE